MAKTNTMPLSEEEALKRPSNFSQDYYHGFFASRRMPGTNNLAAICLPVGCTQAPLPGQAICLPVSCTQAPPPEQATASFGSQQEGQKEAILSECSERRHNLTMDASTLRKVLDERIAKMAAKKLVALDPIMQLTHHILGMMPNKFKKIQTKCQIRNEQATHWHGTIGISVQGQPGSRSQRRSSVQRQVHCTTRLWA
jgi:hypothetical protein